MNLVEIRIARTTNFLQLQKKCCFVVFFAVFVEGKTICYSGLK